MLVFQARSGTRNEPALNSNLANSCRRRPRDDTNFVRSAQALTPVGNKWHPIDFSADPMPKKLGIKPNILYCSPCHTQPPVWSLSKTISRSIGMPFTTKQFTHKQEKRLWNVKMPPPRRLANTLKIHHARKFQTIVERRAAQCGSNSEQKELGMFVLLADNSAALTISRCKSIANFLRGHERGGNLSAEKN